MATGDNKNALTAIIVGVAALVAVFLFSGGSNSNDSGRSSGSQNGSGNSSGVVGMVAKSTPIPDAVVTVDPIVQPVNTVTDGSVWQGPDPLNLAPGEEGRGDLIGPVNPGNVVAGGPVYTGPDPLNLGGGSGGSSSGSSNSGGGGWVNSDNDGAAWDGPDPLGLGGS